MGQPWRRVEHLRKGKALIKRCAEKIIDRRLYSWSVEPFYINKKHLCHMTLYIESKHSVHKISVAFQTKYMEPLVAETSIITEQIKKAIFDLEYAQKNAHWTDLK